MKHLKDFGFGKVGLQGVIQDEVEDLVKYFLRIKNQDFRYNCDVCINMYVLIQAIQNGDCIWCASYKCSLVHSGWEKVSNGRPKSSENYGIAEQVLQIEN